MADGARDLIEQALVAQQRGDAVTAEVLLRRAAALRPELPDALYLLGGLLARRGQRAEARDLVERAVAGRPQAPDFRYGLGNLLIAEGRADEAATEFRRAIALKPGLLLRPQQSRGRATPAGRSGWRSGRVAHRLCAEARHGVVPACRRATAHLRAGGSGHVYDRHRAEAGA